jgi:integrase
VARNVAALAKPPGAQRMRVEPFSPAEALRFLGVVCGDPLEALYVTTLGLGLRRGEVLGLRWSDIKLSARTVTVAGQLQGVKDVGVIWQVPKTDASIAVIDVPDFVLDALAAHRDRQVFMQGSPRWRNSGYVFTSKNRGPLEPDNVTHHFPRFLKDHGLRHQRFHDLRHASIAITSDTYDHLYAETSRTAADTMNAFMSQAPRCRRRCHRRAARGRAVNYAGIKTPSES